MKYVVNRKFWGKAVQEWLAEVTEPLKPQNTIDSWLNNHITFCTANEDEAELKARIEKTFGYDMSTECVSGQQDILSWNVLPNILHMTLPCPPVYTAILILRRLTAMKLKREHTISENSRRLQSQLLKVSRALSNV
ncbi:hypothetical protein COOONC_22490 [Cooperia oncophora]